jgi:hypothetical protein
VSSPPPRASTPGPLDYLPSRFPPLLYFGFAHACLAAAFALVALDPRGVGGFFYHPRMLAVVHLVTLGWIGGSILGSIYLVGPLALRFPLPAGRWDQAAFASFAVGVLGMTSHFWIDRYPGMVWSAALVTAAFVRVAARVLGALPRAAVPREVKLHVGFAFANALLVAVLGVLLGMNKTEPFLPFAQLRGVLAHAHLAVLGFGALIVMGAGYRLIPMILPAAMPRGLWPYASALLTQAGVLALTASLLTGRFLIPAIALTLLGLFAFLSRVAWMLRHLRPAPAALRKPDWSVLHALQSFAYLTFAAGLGFTLAVAAPAEWTLAAAMAYGVFGLVGFLSQIVVGVEGRLLPLASWLWSYAGGGFREKPPSLYAAPVRSLQALGFLLWTLGVPLLAGGLALDRPHLTTAGATLLFLAVVGNAVNTRGVLAGAHRRRPVDRFVGGD